MNLALFLLGAAISLFRPGMDVTGYEKVPPPSMEMRTDRASATSVPWVDANGWRFQRGIHKAFYAELPSGKAALAAAEAYAYGVDAVLQPAPEDEAALNAMLDFIKRVDAPRMPVLANVGLIDDGSEEFAEVLNLMSRRNLLYRVVKPGDKSLPLLVKPGTQEFPKESMQDPNEFAARVRAKISDEKRLLRIYNSYTVIAHLTGNAQQARLHILNYARRPARDVRVRVLGNYPTVRLAEANDPKLQATDVASGDGATEFTIPTISTYAVIDLDRKR